jgi:hypothetical protein
MILKNVSAKKWRFLLKPLQVFEKHELCFLRKTPIFRRKLSKIEENCDHNIGPRCAHWVIAKFLTVFENFRSSPYFVLL